MAKAIQHYEKQQPDKVTEQTEALQALLNMTAESRDALLSTLEIVQELNNSGLLDIVKGALRTRHKIGVLAIHELNQPGMHRIIRNGMNMVQFLSQLDPNKTSNLLKGVIHGVEQAADSLDRRERVGVRHLLKTFRDPEINTSLALLLNFLQGMGHRSTQLNHNTKE